MSFNEQINTELQQLKSISQYRQLRTIDCIGKFAMYNNQKYLNLSGNDYLGVASDIELRNQFFNEFNGSFSTGRAALSAASSRLLTGNSYTYNELENKLASMYRNSRAALVFNSGYHANVGILPALSRKGDLVLSDKLNHASIIDGLKLCDCDFKRYQHNNMEQLEQLISNNQDNYRQIFVISESIFSMDGDWADLLQLVELKKKYQFCLIIDEAHSVGVFGENGEGLCHQLGIDHEVDIIVGTFGKAFGSVGAYGIMDSNVREYLINCMRPMIFTTGLAPINLAWSKFVLDLLPDMKKGRENLLLISKHLRENLRDKGYETLGNSQIVPLILGENSKAEAMANYLQSKGVLVFPIRPPTVPKNSARLRFSLNGALNINDINYILELL